MNARYASAAELADDLERALSHRPIVARRSTVIDRIHRWTRRHPVLAGTLVVVGVLAATVLGLTQSLVQVRNREREEIVNMNAFTASGQAGAALFQLSDYARKVQNAAGDPAIHDMARKVGEVDLQPAELKRYIDEGFDSLLVLDTEGRPHAHLRDGPSNYFERNFAFRDYFQQARVMAGRCPKQAYLARAFRSEEDGKIKFALSAPMVDGEGTWIGVFVGIIQADSAFGEVQLHDVGGDHSTALLGPRDRDRNIKHLPSDFTFLVHQGILDRVEYVLHDAASPTPLTALSASKDPCEQFKLRRVTPMTWTNYRDPVPGFDGRWLAAIAPVGQTGYLVVVQTRFPETFTAP